MSEELVTKHEEMHTIYLDGKSIPFPILSVLILLEYDPDSTSTRGEHHQNLLAIKMFKELPNFKFPGIPVHYELLKQIISMFKSYQYRGRTRQYTTHEIQKELYKHVLDGLFPPAIKSIRRNALQALIDEGTLVGGNFSLVLNQTINRNTADALKVSRSFTGAVAAKMECMTFGDIAPIKCPGCFYGPIRGEKLMGDYPLSKLPESSGRSIAGCPMSREEYSKFSEELDVFEQYIDDTYNATYNPQNQNIPLE